VIAAPKTVRLQRHWRLTSLPLCGRYLLPVRRRPFATLLEGLRVHVRDEATQEVVSGVLADGDTNLPDPEANDLPDEDLKNLQVGGCFTSDLLAHVELAVDEPARYTVWLELKGELKSNEVQVELVAP
jgi:hypothetical protein